MKTRTWSVPDPKPFLNRVLAEPPMLSAAADGLRQRTLGWAYFERLDSVFWHELTDAEKAPWIESARAETLEALRRAS